MLSMPGPTWRTSACSTGYIPSIRPSLTTSALSICTTRRLPLSRPVRACSWAATGCRASRRRTTTTCTFPIRTFPSASRRPTRATTAAAWQRTSTAAHVRNGPHKGPTTKATTPFPASSATSAATLPSRTGPPRRARHGASWRPRATAPTGAIVTSGSRIVRATARARMARASADSFKPARQMAAPGSLAPPSSRPPSTRPGAVTWWSLSTSSQLWPGPAPPSPCTRWGIWL
mmetsp:Transcript_48919/g.156639  ORF Transcript_48919/g.156639 Transcript_48919/m.156639 type:complete len:232 (+) Transcript_48919:1462-2157(+)